MSTIYTRSTRTACTFKTAQKCQQYIQEALGQHTRSKQPTKCQQYKQEALGQHTRSKQPKKNAHKVTRCIVFLTYRNLKNLIKKIPL